MANRSVRTSILHLLFALCVVGIVTVLPGLAASHSRPTSILLANESGDDADSKADILDFELSTLFAVIATFDGSTPPDYAWCVADESVDRVTANQSAHLQRGPPLA